MIKLLGLISPVIVPLIVAGILIFSSEKKNRPRHFLVVYMLVISFVFLANYYYFEHRYDIYIWLHSLHIGTVLAIYPGSYVYIRLLTNPGVKNKELAYHFIPSLFFFLSSAFIFFLFLNPDERVIFLTEYRFQPDFSKTWMKILYFIRMGNILILFLQVFVYLILIMRVLRKHRKTMAEIFSNPEKFQLNWLRHFNISLSLSAFVCVFLYTVNPAKLFGDDRFLAYPMLLIALILWFLGIMGNNQNLLPEQETAGSQSPSLPGQEKNDLPALLKKYFKEKKPYLDPELKIWDVCRELGSNRTYISQAINQNFNTNFAGFVNSFRVEEAKHILEKDPGTAINLLAAEVGFGSASSLSRSFREKYKMNISEFRTTLRPVAG